MKTLTPLLPTNLMHLPVSQIPVGREFVNNLDSRDPSSLGFLSTPSPTQGGTFVPQSYPPFSPPLTVAENMPYPLDLNAIQGYTPRSNPYSNSYHPGWRNHPNFSWFDHTQRPSYPTQTRQNPPTLSFQQHNARPFYVGSQNPVGPNRDSQLDQILRAVTERQRQNAEALASNVR